MYSIPIWYIWLPIYVQQMWRFVLFEEAQPNTLSER